MITEDQAEVIELLGRSSTHGGAAVERIDTHSAIVFLAGTQAWKLKRAVRFDYLDFSTGERRRTFCDAEVRLNRRTAPTVYRRVVAVTREPDGSLAIGGAGTPVDWLIEMHRFDQDALFDRLAQNGTLTLDLMPPLGSRIAQFHREAARRQDHGGRAAMNWVIQGNADGFAEYGDGVFEPAASDRTTRAACAELQRYGALLDTRRDAEFVRQCHGDLHLRNIVLLDGQPTLFDGIEFNDEIACVDVLYDLAFLLMDLWQRRLPCHANAVWNTYLADTDDFDGLRLMPLFLSCRAAVRAKTSATAARLQTDAARACELRRSAREYLDTAERLLHQPRPSLIAVGGFSGSGKSTLAMALAPTVGAVPGAVVIRSDEVRKHLCGVPRLARLGPESYGPDVSARAYATVAERAARVVRSGHSAIVDAVHARPADRQAIELVAAAAAVPFLGLWLDAPEDTLIRRVQARRLDPSDADPAVVRTQLAQDTGPIGWQRLEASLPAAALLRRAAACVSNLAVGAVDNLTEQAR